MGLAPERAGDRSTDVDAADQHGRGQQPPDRRSRQGQQNQPQPAVLEKLPTKHLPNALQVHPKVISGGQPEGEAGFAELKELGIETIVTVDGAKPDVELAKKYGLRYVHLPHGYDGIPEERVEELAKAVRDLPGPIYIHCHHGKHRSPAAASAACVGAGLIDPKDARQVLVVAGTSESYRGLYQTAANNTFDDILPVHRIGTPISINFFIVTKEI